MITTLPYTDPKTNNPYKRLIVEPVPIPQKVTESGIIIPEHESPLCETGTVISAGEDSTFMPGDCVLYNKIDRSSGEHLDTISINGKVCDVLFEEEILCVNEQPWNQIFVRPLSEVEISGSGLIIPHEVKSITQKGVVVAAAEKYGLKPGDKVEYRKPDSGYVMEIELNGDILDVLFERDIFLVNGRVAPYRMIVKVDLVAQFIKRNTSDSGLLLSPLFIHMLHNLQYGEIEDIGTEASKLYPELKVGDTAILHHCVESQEYRMIRYEPSKNNNIISASLIINCWDEKSEEILGKMSYQRETGKILSITPFHGDVFCHWDFNVFEGEDRSASPLLMADTDIHNCHNLDDLTNAIKQKQKFAAEKAKLKTSGIKMALSTVNRELEPDKFNSLNSEFRMMQREETAVSRYLRRDHLLTLKSLYPRQIPSYLIAFYEELYPINLLGQKFLIAHKQFTLAKTNTNMNITGKDIFPLSETVLVLPIEEESDSDLIIPDSAKERPQRGKVIAIDETQNVKKGDDILFIKNAGMEQYIDGVRHLFLRKNDLVAIIKSKS